MVSLMSCAFCSSKCQIWYQTLSTNLFQLSRVLLCNHLSNDIFLYFRITVRTCLSDSFFFPANLYNMEEKTSSRMWRSFHLMLPNCLEFLPVFGDFWKNIETHKMFLRSGTMHSLQPCQNYFVKKVRKQLKIFTIEYFSSKRSSGQVE